MGSKTPYLNLKLLFITIIISALTTILYGEGLKKTTSANSIENVKVSGKNGDAYRLYINNINLPLNRDGIIATVDLPDPNPLIAGEGGKYKDKLFLYSGGFFLSGYANEQLWANGVAEAANIEDYIHGIVGGGNDDPRAQLYVLKKSDDPFGQSWQDWIDAVALGADFYDGDSDGKYTPIDYNQNGQWDSNEDAPDILGDETVWCVYNDGIEAGERRFNNVSPLGIEIRQTVFVYASTGTIGNIFFVRYRVKYVGIGSDNEPEKLDSVYFGVWTDADIGFPYDDLTGYDMDRNAGIFYNKLEDEVWENQPPCLMVDLLSGPVTYIPGETFTDNNGNAIYDDGIDIPLDTAHSFSGQLIGIKKFPGAKNLTPSSFVCNSRNSSNILDPGKKEQARSYMLGLDRDGTQINPCEWHSGEVIGVDCNSVDKKFWYSGDPVTNIGFLDTLTFNDKRIIHNIGPFNLQKGTEQEIIVAYAVEQGDNSLDAITEARVVDDYAQLVFENNFSGSITDINLDEKILLNDFKLYQNYPNPFNPTTTIKYTIPVSSLSETSTVKLIVYDLLGREVTTLVDEIKTAGNYEVNFNASNLVSGIYFYKLTAGTHIQSKKMLLIK